MIKIKSWIKVLLFSLLIAEIFFLAFGQNKTISEKISGRYASPFKPFNNTHYHLWNHTQPTHTISKGEYTFVIPTNSLGFPDIDWSKQKADQELRILALGDSFTEGDGAPADSSYPALLRSKLLSSGYIDIKVMNAGVCGSDPFYNFISLKDKLVTYQPDIILQCISTHDMTTDILLRGGFERFLPNGNVKFAEGPWWEPIYAVSNVSRVFFAILGYTELLKKPSPTPEELENIETALLSLINEYTRLSNEINAKLIFVLRPDKDEIVKGKYRYNFAPSIKVLDSLKVTVFDLLPCYLSALDHTNTKTEDYFWKIDGHHNSKGYEMMAECIYKNIQESNLLVTNDSTKVLE